MCPAIPLLGTHPEETKTEKDTCIPVFIVALFTQQLEHGSNLDVHQQMMDKEVVVHIHNGIFLSHKKNTFGLVLMRQKNLMPIIQRDISHKEKNKYHILIHVYGIQEDGTDEVICMAAMETHREQAG